MSRYLFFVLGLAISVANAGEQSPSKTADQEQHDLAYSLGASLGERLRQAAQTQDYWADGTRIELTVSLDRKSVV